MTAAQMAEHFGVSQRTIYRWVDALNLAGVPVITTNGKNVFSDYDEPVESFETVRLQVKDSSMFMILDEYAVEKIEDCPPCSLFVWTFQTCKIVK